MARQQTALVEQVTAADNEETDDILVTAVAQGDRRAFAALLDRYNDRIYGFAARLVGTAEAEDAVQDAFLKLWNDAKRWQADKGRFAPWFFRIVYNLCIDRLRRKQAVPYDDLSEFESSEPTPEASMADSMRRTTVAAALERLPERQRAAVMLCYYQGFSNREAAEALDVGVKGLEALLVRARRQLAKELAVLRHEESLA